MTLPPTRFRSRDRPAVSITDGNLNHAVWSLAWPTVVTNIQFSATGLINMIFVGRLGKDAMAVVGRSEVIMFLLMSVITSVSVGASALVARAIGGGDLKTAETASRQSLVMGTLGSAISALFLISSGHLILYWMSARGADLELSAQYLKVLGLVQLPLFLIIVIGAIFRGVGDMRTPMYLMIAVNGLQVVLDWGLIFGAGPFPHLGVMGAAWSWLISRTVGAVLSVVFLGKLPLHMWGGDWNPRWDWFRRIWAIGMPTAVQQMLRTTGSMVFIGILGHLPNAVASVATLTVGMRIESIAFMPGFGYSMAAVTLVGQNLGAKRPDRAERAGWLCAYQAMAMMGVAGLCFILFPHAILAVFTNDPDVIPLGVQYLHANGLAQPFLALGIALSGALQGAGETRVPAWVTFITMWVARVPLTFWLAEKMGYGAAAAWAVMAGTNALYGVIITGLFRSGKWKQKEI